MIKNGFKKVLIGLCLLYSTQLLAAYNTALLNLKPLDIDSIGFDGDIQYALRSSLDKSTEVQMLSRRDMESELFRQGIAIGGNFDDVLKAGKALGVEFIIYGSVQMSDEGIATVINMIDVIHGVIAKEFKLTFSGRNDINDKGGIIANDFIKAMAASINNAKINALTNANQDSGAKKLLSSFEAQARQQGINIIWQAVEPKSIKSYNLYRAENSAGPFIQIALLDSASFSYLDSQVTSGLTYYYKIGVVLTDTDNQAEDISISQALYIDERLKHRPLSPTILNVETQVKRSNITFVPNLDNPGKGHKIKQYKIYRTRSDTKHWIHVGSLTLNSEEPKLSYQYSDKTNISDGVSYSYAVSSVNDKNKESALSGTEIIISPQTPVLSIAKNNLLRAVELTWQVDNKTAGFYVYRRVLGTTIWQRVGDVPQADVRRFIDTQSLQDGMAYEYYVSLNDASQESDPSNIIVANTKELPPQVMNLSAESDLIQTINLTWQAAVDNSVSGYKVYRMEDDGNGFQEGDQLSFVYAIAGADITEFADTGTADLPLKHGAQYHYAVAAVNKFGGRGPLSFVASATTKALPSHVSRLSVEPVQAEIKISWPLITTSEIKHYHLSRQWDEESWRTIAVLTAEQNFFIDKELKPLANARYKLIAEDVAGLMSLEVLSDYVANPVK